VGSRLSSGEGIQKENEGSLQRKERETMSLYHVGH